MGIGKKPVRASDAELEAFWPEHDDGSETDWGPIIRHLMRPAPLGMGMSMETIGNLTIGQLDFLLSPDKDKKEAQSVTRKQADRLACGYFLKMMRRTGWSVRKLESLPIETLCRNYLIDSDGVMPGKQIVEMQFHKFVKRYYEYVEPKLKPRKKKP